MLYVNIELFFWSLSGFYHYQAKTMFSDSMQELLKTCLHVFIAAVKNDVSPFYTTN